jgi:glycosyltransferase involved in cell wall biosynthesis
VKIDPATLPRRPNLHWLGQQDYAFLPQLVAGWDVCLMPFARNESTEFISPTKTLEYMAATKPVVSTPIHDVEALFGELVAIASTADAFIGACCAALNESDASRASREEKMRACVGRYSWDATAATIAAALDAVLDDKRRVANAPAGTTTSRRVPAAGGALHALRLGDVLG